MYDDSFIKPASKEVSELMDYNSFIHNYIPNGWVAEISDFVSVYDLDLVEFTELKKTKKPELIEGYSNSFYYIEAANAYFYKKEISDV